MNKKISIIYFFDDDKKWVTETLLFLLELDPKKFDIMLMCNANKKENFNTLSLFLKLQKNNVEIFYFDDCATISYAYNIAIQNSKNDLIYFLNFTDENFLKQNLTILNEINLDHSRTSVILTKKNGSSFNLKNRISKGKFISLSNCFFDLNIIKSNDLKFTDENFNVFIWNYFANATDVDVLVIPEFLSSKNDYQHFYNIIFELEDFYNLLSEKKQLFKKNKEEIEWLFIRRVKNFFELFLMERVINSPDQIKSSRVHAQAVLAKLFPNYSENKYYKENVHSWK